LRHIIIYDVTDDNLRNQVSEILKDYGLERIQYSAFLGQLRHDELNSLLVDLRELIGPDAESVQIYPVCDSCYKGKREVGKQKRYEYNETKRTIAYF
jgi:CRISPR-associated protein Cas2